MNRKFLVITCEVCFEIDNEITHSVQSTLDELRSYAAARVVDFAVLEGADAYDTWYKDPRRIQEVDIPSPATLHIEWD